MIITMNAPTTEQINRILEKMSQCRLEPHCVEKYGKIVITAIGDPRAYDIESYKHLPGVEEVTIISVPFKLASREFRRETTKVKIGAVEFGGLSTPVIAGSYAIESYEQLKKTALSVKYAGAAMLRGGTYKPRTAPYSFQGLEEEGLKIIQAVGREVGLPTVSEVTDPRDVELVASYVEMLQIGTHNMQNFVLLKEVAKSGKPILIKRGASATIEEWLMAAEYILAGGNNNVVLCEQGIRTFEPLTRNTLDLSAVPVVQQLSHLPIIVDPSHGTGAWRLVCPMAKAALAAGADGLVIEVHSCLTEAVSDGMQSLDVEKFSDLMKELTTLRVVLRQNK